MRDSSVSVVERCAFPMLAPSASTSAALIESEIGVSSGPLAADTVRLGASACSASESSEEPTVEVKPPLTLVCRLLHGKKKGALTVLRGVLRPPGSGRDRRPL